MARSITLSKRLSKNSAHDYKLVVEATTSLDMGKEVFVMIRLPYNPISTVHGHVYAGVASPGDFVHLPVQEPLPGENKYRTAICTQIFPSAVDADKAWDAAQLAVGKLIRDLNALDTIDVTETATITG